MVAFAIINIEIDADGGAMSLSTKEATLQLIGSLPDEVTLNDIMYELYIKHKIQAGMRDIEGGRTIPHAEVKRQLLNRAD